MAGKGEAAAAPPPPREDDRKDSEELEGKLTDPFFAKYCKSRRHPVRRRRSEDGRRGGRRGAHRAIPSGVRFQVSDGAGEIGGAALRAKADPQGQGGPAPRQVLQDDQARRAARGDGPEDARRRRRGRAGSSCSRPPRASTPRAPRASRTRRRRRGGAAAKAAAAAARRKVALRGVHWSAIPRTRRARSIFRRGSAAPARAARGDLGRGAPAPARGLRRGREPGRETVGAARERDE